MNCLGSMCTGALCEFVRDAGETAEEVVMGWTGVDGMRELDSECLSILFHVYRIEIGWHYSAGANSSFGRDFIESPRDCIRFFYHL